VIARRWWADGGRLDGRRWSGSFSGGHQPLDSASVFDYLLAVLRGKVPTTTPRRAVPDGAADRGCVHSALHRSFEARLLEVAHRLSTDPQPFLLATPTWGSGLLDPGELVDRLDAYRRLGARVSAVDFGQALLRVRLGDRAAAAAAARRASALGTEQGERLARWLTTEETVLPTSRWTTDVRVLLDLGEVPALHHDLPDGLDQLGRPVSAQHHAWYCHDWHDGQRQHWPALLPERPELVAARLLPDLSAVSVDNVRGPAAVLPRLAEAEGDAGEAVHLCLAYGLGARHADDRLAAVDALLVLAARGRLDPGRLGTDLGQLVRSGAVKPVRLADAVRTAATTGAKATVWGVLREMLPVLLADLATGARPDSARGLGELRTVAAECAERTGARGDLPHLAEAATSPVSALRSRLTPHRRKMQRKSGKPSLLIGHRGFVITQHRSFTVAAWLETCLM
jgi:hypothetical protein